MTDHELLGLPADALPAQVKERWRELAAIHHPDKGGDAETFAAMRDAYERCAERSAKLKCPVCRGTKRVDEATGFYSVSVVCKACDGTGKPQPKPPALDVVEVANLFERGLQGPWSDADRIAVATAIKILRSTK